MKKLVLLMLTLLLTACTHHIAFWGVVCEVRNEKYNIYGESTEYVIVVSEMDPNSISSKVEICTNELYNVGDTVVFTKH